MMWGGNWTEQKLTAFEKYVRAYLKIMNAYRDKYGWKLIYFDAFAGDGSRGGEPSPSLVDFGINAEELDVYKGSAQRVLEIEGRGFDYYYFVERNDKSRNALQKRLTELNEPNAHCRELLFRNDANKELLEFANKMKGEKLRALALLDPFGMQVEWKSIEGLKGAGVDLWILIPSGVIVNRLLDKEGKLTHIEKLEAFFGLTKDEITSAFYEEKKEPSLFGENTITTKLPNSIEKIVDLYKERLKTVFNFVVDKPLTLKNGKNVPIYSFAFSSNNKTAVGIAGRILATKRQTKSPAATRGLF
jgi:three-Cys-motif partner protein